MLVKEIKELENDRLINLLICESGTYNNGVMTNKTVNEIIKLKKELLKRLGDIDNYTSPF